MGVKLVSYIKDEHRLMVFENKVLRRIFRPKREEICNQQILLEPSSQEGEGYSM
jgi:hypothetical protein